MIEPDSRVVITDFGLAQPIHCSSDAAGQTGATIAGTLSYMAPEVLAGQAASARSDIYSLGILLYEAATGQLPFESAGPLASVIRRAIEIPPPPSALNRQVTTELDEAILACVRPDGMSRPPGAADVLRRTGARPGASRRKILIAGASAATAVSLFALVSRYGRQEGRPSGIHSLLIAFQNHENPRVLGMATLLKQQLKQSVRFEVLSEDDSRVKDLLARMQRPPNGPLDVSHRARTGPS